MIFLLACSEYVVNQEVKRDPVQQPPITEEDYEGQPPNWGACAQGFSAVYFNHDASHIDYPPTFCLLVISSQFRLRDKFKIEFCR